MKKIEKSIDFGGRKLSLTTGNIAGQASGAVLAQYGETVVLATVVSADLKMELDYFPLSVEYQERLYAGGKIKGSRWVKREGRPTDEEILTARVIDRSIRPLFPKDYKKDVQVITTVLSVDLENSPRDLAPIAASAAIHLSDIPWDGPVSVMTVGLNDGKYITNPTEKDLKDTEMELVVSSTKDAIIMVEAGANQVSEKAIVDGIAHAQKESKNILKFIEDFAKEVGNKKEKVEKVAVDVNIQKQVEKLVKGNLPDYVKRLAGKDRLKDVYEAIAEEVGEENTLAAHHLFDDMMKAEIKGMILKGKRPDGRKLTEIRKLSSEVGIIPRVHGSGLFTRGTTQALTITTLGSPSMGQLLETAEGEEEKRYIHHYSMPPYSTGETGRVGSPSRREIGHGALAERALFPVIPDKNRFPYTIRVVSEILSSNGSTSMASTCGSTLSLMDAGVPLEAPVSGIAMGLVIKDEKNFAVLSDIAGIEDFNGDMDFKVTGTQKGITALQLDVKTLSLTLSILEQALAQAKEGRAFILDSMLKTIKAPRETVSASAPKIKSLKIDPAKIGELIGPGGKTIKKLIAETGADIDVEDDGTVSITAVDSEAVDKAYETVDAMTKEVVPGEIYEGEVKRIESFGAFVEILPGRDGMVHISDMATGYVNKPEEVVSMGQKVQVRVKEIDNMGRINLSMILDPKDEVNKPPRQPQRSGNFRGGGRPGGNRDRRDNRGNRGGRNDRRTGRGERGSSSGPHFPASRLISNRDSKRFNR